MSLHNLFFKEICGSSSVERYLYAALWSSIRFASIGSHYTSCASWNLPGRLSPPLWPKSTVPPSPLAVWILPRVRYIAQLPSCTALLLSTSVCLVSSGPSLVSRVGTLSHLLMRAKMFFSIFWVYAHSTFLILTFGLWHLCTEQLAWQYHYNYAKCSRCSGSVAT